MIVHQLIQKLKDDPSIDYASNTIIPSWPEGVDMEVLRYKIYSAHHEAVLKSDREHVTSFIITRPNRFKLFNLLSDRDLSRWRWTVDKPADLEFANLFIPSFVTRRVFRIMMWLSALRIIHQC